MYKVFVNDRPIFLTAQEQPDQLLLKNVNIVDLARMLAKDKRKEAYLFHENEEVLLTKFKKLLPVVTASGGLVKNKKGEILFIKRNGKWDLPKGRVERKEDVGSAAIRETEEETGVTGLEIVKPLQVTYHLFNRNNSLKIKETYWFEMKTTYTGSLVPQTNEGITKVRWKNSEKVKEALQKSYANIQELFV
ncbi:MAG TPA: NUDIX domain-containing protein [Flavobacteriaceae bacterium]|nr:NUDIX domain-containing protein [Flavobacteriaceae bacterium]